MINIHDFYIFVIIKFEHERGTYLFKKKVILDIRLKINENNSENEIDKSIS